MAETWRWRDSGEPLYISRAAGSLTLSFGGRSNFSFDRAGRLVGVWYDAITYRRALDNRVLAKWADPAQPALRCRQLLGDDAAHAVIARAYAAAARVLTGVHTGLFDLVDAQPDFVAAVTDDLSTIHNWDDERLHEDATRFRTIYKPVSILPPDQYLAVVLQATEGCSYNRCSFCTFYRDRPFRIKSATEFAQHIQDVTGFLGAGVSLRRSIFLADANAVVIPQHQLLPILDLVNAAFSWDDRRTVAGPHDMATPSLSGIYAFISAPDALRKDESDFAAMAQRHVRRLYVGLETGHDPLRHFLAKAGHASDVYSAVATIKAGGISVGLIFMVGVGGVAFRKAHFADTIALIQRMPLGRGDLVYISPFVAADDSPYLEAMRAAGYASLSEPAIRTEEERFRSALAPWAKSSGVRISHYDVREFIY